ncbi:MAG: hypothetical protein AB1649_02170, partial [Chloroflexota bacterium]
IVNAEPGAVTALRKRLLSFEKPTPFRFGRTKSDCMNHVLCIKYYESRNFSHLIVWCGFPIEGTLQISPSALKRSDQKKTRSSAGFSL